MYPLYMAVKERVQAQTGYTIQEAGERLGLSPYTLRYYEKEGLIQGISRAESGHRLYTEHDLSWIGFITCLKGTGMTLEQIKEFTGLPMDGESGIDKRIAVLKEHRCHVMERLDEIKNMLARIDGKISWYEGQKKQ